MLQGPNLQLLRDVCAATDRPVVASGGVTTLDDIAALMELVPDGVEGAIAGTALYEGRFTLEDALAADPGRAAMTLAVRVIPCLDVDGGRVVKGVNFRRPARRRRPRRARPPLRRRGRRRADLPRHLRLPRGPRHHDGGGLALRRGGLHPAHRRRRRLLGRRRRPAAARRRRQGRRQHRRHPPPRARGRDRRPVRQPGARALRRRPPRAAGTDSGFEVTTHGGRKSAGLDAVAWAARAAELGAGEILLNAMDADGTQDGFDLELVRRSAPPSRSR